MINTWEIVEFAPYLRSRWKLVAAACVFTLTLTLGISLLLAKRYTANVVITIDPQAGNDVRMATAVSPVYLESLKGYEHLAASDSLFARAVDIFHLNNGSEPIESMKRRVLKISKIRETRILEISATLPDPQMAHRLAKYIADQTVKMTQEDNLAGDRSRVEEVQRQLTGARIRLDNTSKASPANRANSSIEALQSRNDSDQELLAKLRHELADLEADAAEYSTIPEEKDVDADGRRVNAAHARARVIQATLTQLEREISSNQTLIDAASSRREIAEAELNIARSEYEGIANRLLDVQTSSGSGGERLRIIDPGIVPQRPSFPNIPLNLALALASTLMIAILYIALSFSYERRRVQEALFR